MHIEVYEGSKLYDLVESINLNFGSLLSANSYYAIAVDVKNLAMQLIIYLNTVYKNFTFTNFTDKEFLEIMKNLIKSETDFNQFLDLVGLDIQTFIRLIVYIAPQMFTSNLVKFIQKTYLKIEPVGKKFTKR